MAAAFQVDRGDERPSPEEPAGRTPLLQRLRGWVIRPLGLEPSPELVAVAIGYFVQGIKMSLGTLTEQYYVKDDLRFSPAQADTWKALAHIPWMIKPAYGFFTDTFPIMGLRRRPYIIICGLTGALAFGMLGVLPPRPGAALLFMALGELAIAFSDVVIDGVVVELTRGEEQATAGSLQSLCWGSQAIGVLSSAYTSGWLVGRVGARPVLCLMALFPLLMCATSGLIREDRRHAGFAGVHKEEGSGDAAGAAAAPQQPGVPGEDGEAQRLLAAAHGRQQQAPHGQWQHLRQQLWTLWQAITMPGILLPALFVFVWQAAPNPQGSMFFFYTNYLGFTPEFVGRIKLLDGVAQLVGVYLFNAFLRKIELQKLFLWLALAGVGARMTQLLLVTGANRALGIPDKAFVLVDSVLITGLGRIALMPTLVLCARICPEGVEATLYAALMSVANASYNTGELLGALCTQLLGITAHVFTNMPWLILISALCGLLPLPFLRFIRRSYTAVPGDEPFV